MPKIIEHLRCDLLRCARDILQQEGYSALTMRRVAGSCNIALGTIYNYFPSKEVLLANYMLSDWNQCMAAIIAVSTYSPEAEPVVRCIFDQLIGFARKHETIFRDTSAASAFAGSFSRYHSLLRSQLADPLRKFCSTDFAADFIAESLLTWTMAGKPFDEIYGMIAKLL